MFYRANETAKPAPKAKAEPKTPTVCWCGCGGMTKSRFVPGHDGRFHGQAKKVARGLLTLDLSKLPHDEARADFQAHVDKAATTAAAWLAAEAEKVRRREEKAKKAAAEKTEAAVVPEPVAATVIEEDDLPPLECGSDDDA